MAMNVDIFKIEAKHKFGMEVKDCRSYIKLKLKENDNM